MTFDLANYTIRRKIFKIFGASFQIFDSLGNRVGFCRQKAFKLKEDIRIYRDDSMTVELLVIQARQVLDFSAAFDIVGEDSRKVGAARRKGFQSILKDTWEVLDENDRMVAQVSEDSTLLALARRFLSNLIPQKFHLKDLGGTGQAEFRVHFNPFVYKLSVSVSPTASLDRRLILGVAILISSIEGRQG